LTSSDKYLWTQKKHD
jgi:hypothetical protein